MLALPMSERAATDRREQTAVRRLLEAVDESLAANRKLQQARDDLDRLSKPPLRLYSAERESDKAG
jgi:hypothetical protein